MQTGMGSEQTDLSCRFCGDGVAHIDWLKAIGDLNSTEPVRIFRANGEVVDIKDPSRNSWHSAKAGIQALIATSRSHAACAPSLRARNWSAERGPVPPKTSAASAAR